MAHSLSPLMMQAAFQKLQHRAIYVALELDNPEEDFSTLHKMGFLGLSVTLPHKEWALRLATRVDETARIIGAVNTLKRSPEGWAGRNTDWLGSNRALGAVLDLRGKQGLVLGAGGAARALVYGLQHEGVAVTVSNRGEERGAALAKAFRCPFISLNDLHSESTALHFDLVVQCTPVGLKGDRENSIAPPHLFREGMVVMDTVYRPCHTPFVKQAMRAGCRVVSGLEMLLHQGVEQIKWWLDLPNLPEELIQEMREILHRAVTEDDRRSQKD